MAWCGKRGGSVPWHPEERGAAVRRQASLMLSEAKHLLGAVVSSARNENNLARGSTRDGISYTGHQRQQVAYAICAGDHYHRREWPGAEALLELQIAVNRDEYVADAREQLHQRTVINIRPPQVANRGCPWNREMWQ